MFNIEEYTVIQQALNSMTIQGANAKYLAALQSKIENQISEIRKALKEKEEAKKEILTQGKKETK